jgi:molybdopterin/thiamine biosynthesis adenylyltransferase
MITVGYMDEDRFDRMRRIEWVDVEAIHRARCLVAGAGALGNEVVKDMVLAGFRRIDIVDMDGIVPSNLSRCLFFRSEDGCEVKKAEAVAERAKVLDPDAEIRPIVGRVQDIEDWHYDIVLGCLDNIAARLHVNAHTYYHRVPYIDGATDGMRGKVQVVLTDGPCLQCSMNRTHVREAERRFTCTGNGTVYAPRTAADITTTAVIAAMEVREAMKVASGRVDLCIRNVSYYYGDSGEVETVQVQSDPDCPNHSEAKE